MRVLVFGDSITQGYWAVEHGWVDRLRMHYDARQVENMTERDEPSIFNLGISADNSNSILQRIEFEVKARTRGHHPRKPVIVVQIGVNDSCNEPSEPHIKLEDYKNNLKAIVDIVKPLSSKIVFVGLSACDESKTTPALWGEYYYRNKDIKAYETAMSETADACGIDFIPIFDAFKLKLDDGGNFLPDGIHPNDEGHELIYQIFRPDFEEILA
jgi:lysophospholipase L1-like esterase